MPSSPSSPRPGTAELWRVGVVWPVASALRHAASRLGAARAARSEDRRLFEDVVLAHYAATPGPLTVLSVGTRAYTRGYERLLAPHRLHTIDIDPRAARHGSSAGHVTGCATRASACFAAGSFDLVLFNGVFGWGLDRREDVEAAVRGFATLLRPGGELVVGWNNVFARRPFDFGELQALSDFRRAVFAPLGAAVVELPSASRHRFEFFVRNPAASD